MTSDGPRPSDEEVGPVVDPAAELTPVDGGVSIDGSPLSRAELQRSAIRGASWTLLHTVVAIPIAFAVNILIARVLGVEDYGRLAYLTSVIGIGESIISFGVGIGAVQFGAKAHAAGRIGEVARLLSSAQAVRLATAAPIMTLLVLSVADVGPVLLTISIVFGVLLPALVGGATYCFSIENKTAADAQNAMIVSFVTQMAVVAAVLTIGTADSVFAVRLIFGGIGAATALLYILPVYRRAVLRPRFYRFPAGFWRFALPAGAAGAIGTMIASRLEVVVLTWLGATEAAGLFALAFGMAAHLFGPAQALVGPLVPAVSGLHEVDSAAVRPALLRTLRASSLAVGGIMAVGLPLFGILLPVIYGAAFAAAAPLFIALGISGAAAVIVNPLSAFVTARLLGVRLLVVNVIAVVLNVVLMLVFVPLLGVWGAVVGNAASTVVMLVVLLVGEARLVGVGAVGILGTLVSFAVGAVVAGGTWFAIAESPLPPLLGAVPAGAVGLVGFVGLLWVTRGGLTPDDADAIAESLSARFARPGRAVLAVLASGRPERSTAASDSDVG